MEKFNSNLQQFLDVIKKNYPDQTASIDSHYDFSESNDIYLREFIEICKTIGNDISTKNEIIFSKNSLVLEGVDFYTIWNDENLSDEQRENIWKYLQTLYIFAFEYVKDADFKSIMREFKKIGSDYSKLDQESQTFVNMIESLTEKYKNKSMEEDDDNEQDEDNGNSFAPPDIFGGMIGDLAKEIVNEIDPSSLNLEDPNKLLGNLLSGNFDEENDDSGIMNLVKNITGKIQDKITSGSLDETQLFNEAQNVMKNFSKKGGKGMGIPGMGNPMEMFGNIMKSGMMDNMDEESKNIVNQASNILNKGVPTNVNPSKLQSQAKLKTTRDKLRKRLEEKKKALSEKKKNQKEEIIQEQQPVDLDALVREIEETGNNKKNK